MTEGLLVARAPLHRILILDDGAPLPTRGGVLDAAPWAGLEGHRLWTRKDLAEFIGDEFGARVLGAFERIRPYAFKADLARYCLLHRIGGWYVDYGMSSVTLPPRVAAVDLIAFRDRQAHSHTSWAVHNGLLYARPGLDVFVDAIDRCVRNIEGGFYGPTPLSPTGPPVLGQAIASRGGDLSMILGDFMDLTPIHSRDNLAFVGPDGWIWARHKGLPPGRLDVRGGNAYNDMWHRGCVYSVDPAAERPGLELGAPYRVDEVAAHPRIRHLALRALRDRVTRRGRD